MSPASIKSGNTWTRNEAGKLLEIIPWKGDSYRLIPSRFPPVAVYEALVAPEHMEALVRVEDLTIRVFVHCSGSRKI